MMVQPRNSHSAAPETLHLFLKPTFRHHVYKKQQMTHPKPDETRVPSNILLGLLLLLLLLIILMWWKFYWPAELQ
jgi:hypothetical protein